MPKLNQIVAVEKGVKSRVYGDITELHKTSQKPDLYVGFVKTYEKRDEEGEDLPQERKKVQQNAEDVLKRTSELLTELFDVTAAKDFANCDARADVAINGQVLLRDVPVPFLLFLEKQITDIRTFVDKLPTLDESEDWTADPNSGLFKTPETKTHRTKKVQRPLVLYPHSTEHPAQTQLVTEDVIAGYWCTVKHSGAIPVPRKQALLTRIEALLHAVKFAREQANSVDAPNKEIGRTLFEYLFA